MATTVNVLTKTQPVQCLLHLWLIVAQTGAGDTILCTTILRWNPSESWVWTRPVNSACLH